MTSLFKEIRPEKLAETKNEKHRPLPGDTRQLRRGARRLLQSK